MSMDQQSPMDVLRGIVRNLVTQYVHDHNADKERIVEQVIKKFENTTTLDLYSYESVSKTIMDTIYTAAMQH